MLTDIDVLCPYGRWIFDESHKRLWCSLVKNRQHPLPETTGRDGLPVQPPWEDHPEKLPSGPPKKGNGPPARKPKNGSSPGEGGQMADQMAQQSNIQNMGASALLSCSPARSVFLLCVRMC